MNKDVETVREYFCLKQKVSDSINRLVELKKMETGRFTIHQLSQVKKEFLDYGFGEYEEVDLKWIIHQAEDELQVNKHKLNEIQKEVKELEIDIISLFKQLKEQQNSRLRNQNNLMLNQ